MEHVVFFPGADGAEAYSRAADLDEAVRIVERLRNDNGVGDVSVFALHPVPLAFRTYVHVELTAADEQPVAAAAEGAPIAEETWAEETSAEGTWAEESRVSEVEAAEVGTAEVESTELVADESPAEDTPVAEAVVDEAVVDEDLQDQGQQDEAAPAPVDAEQVDAGHDEAEQVDAGHDEAEAPYEPSAELPEPPVEVPSFEAPSFESEPFESQPVESEQAQHDEIAVAQEPVAEPQADDLGFFEPEPDYAEPVYAQAHEPESAEHVAPAEPSIPPPPPAPPAPGFAEVDGEWTQPEPLVESFAPPAPPVDEVPLPLEALPVPVLEQSASELPPLTLAPGPLLFQDDPAPLAVGSHEAVEDEQPAELPALVPADFNDLIPSDIVHGDLGRPVEEPAHEAFEGQPVLAVAPDAPAEAPVAEALPPLEVEVPADASGLEALAQIPAAREVVEQPAVARPRGLGYFGG